MLITILVLVDGFGVYLPDVGAIITGVNITVHIISTNTVISIVVVVFVIVTIVVSIYFNYHNNTTNCCYLVKCHYCSYY